MQTRLQSKFIIFLLCLYLHVDVFLIQVELLHRKLKAHVLIHSTEDVECGTELCSGMIIARYHIVVTLDQDSLVFKVF